jgi:mRNA interferase RelE/StbE
MKESYELFFTKSFGRDISKIDKKFIPGIIGKILSLEENPRPRQSKKLRGTEDEYRLRIGDYRAFYTINDKDRSVIIYHIAHRGKHIGRNELILCV